MDLNCRTKTGCSEKFCTYCCTHKRDLLRNNNFEKHIEIYPRVVILSKKLKRCESYHQPLTVRNTGTLSRKIKFMTDVNSDVVFKTNGSTELISGGSVSVDLYVEPRMKKSINRNRFLYILAEHPDILWEIPILVMVEQTTIYVPELICLHKVPARTISYYQFIIYNPLETDVTYSIFSKYEGITITTHNNNILGKDYATILVECKVPDEALNTCLVVTLNNAKKCKVHVYADTSELLVHLSTCVLTLKDTYIGLKTQKNIHICNRSMQSVSFEWSVSDVKSEKTTDDKGDEELTLSNFLGIKNKRGCIPPLSSVLSIVTLSPPNDYNYSEDEEPPFCVDIPVYLRCPILSPHVYCLQINANILGPDIEVSPKMFEADDIFMGQIQCLKIEVVNKGPIPGNVYFKGNTDQNEIRCSLSPQSMDLKPNGGSRSFQLSFYRRDIGKFLTKLTFKIKSGNLIPMLIRGNCLTPKVKIWPENFDFGDIPICIPQKRYALIVNPLPVPIVVEPLVIDDGIDDPMVLCVDYSKLPLNTRAEDYANRKSKISVSDDEDEELKPTYSDFDLKGNKTLASSSQTSCPFKDKVIDNIPAMAEELLHDIKLIDAQYLPEPGLKIIDATLDCLLDRSDYFENLKLKQNYLRLDWDALPCDAKEVAIEVERFYLKPNESKYFPVILVSNSLGPGAKTIDFKACPLGIEQSDLKVAIKSRLMVNKLRLNYRCMAPVLLYDDHVKFPKPLYVDMEHIFHMKFKNIDEVPGFVFFKVIPKAANGSMTVNKSQRKFFIASNEEIDVACSVTFRNVGCVRLFGLLKLIGKIMEQTFSIQGDILPPEIDIAPEKVTNKQKVLECTRTKIILENICPTVATFYLSLKCEKYQCLEPLGGSLAPNQKILITLWSKYYDPGIYKNVLYVHLKHTEKLSIHTSFIVEGIPLKFEPNIKLGFDCGNIFRIDGRKDNVIEITNLGEKSYRLLFVKQKAKGNALGHSSVFDVQPCGISLPGKGKGNVNISLDLSKEIIAQEHYAVDGMGEDNYRFKYFKFTAKCTIIKTKVVWSKPTVCFESGSDNESSNKIIDTVSLMNATPMEADIILTVTGPFGIIYKMTGSMPKKTVSFCLGEKATKQFTICLNVGEVDTLDMCQIFNGLVKCKVNNKLQKPLVLHAKIVKPNLKICTEKVTFFTQNAESYTHIKIDNCNTLTASFIWKETTRTVTKPVPKENCDQIFSKTISEIMLSLPEECVPKIPNLIKPEIELRCLCTEAMFDEDGEAQGQSSVSIGRSSSSSSSKEVISKNALPIKMTEQSLATTTNQICQPLDNALKTEAQRIDVNAILDHLGFEEPKPLYSGNENRELIEAERNFNNDDPNAEKKSISFQENTASISPKTTFKAYMFLPPVAEGYTITSTFDLDVIGGKTESLDVTVTSIKGRIQICTTNVDLGQDMWQTTVTGKIGLTNLCPYAVKINLIESNDAFDVERQLINGHVWITSPKTFFMMPDTCTSITWRVLFGLQYNFIEDIGVEVNNNVTAIPIRFHRTGLLPMLVPINLEKLFEISADTTTTSYMAIRKVFERIQKKKIRLQTNACAKDKLPRAESTLSNASSNSKSGRKLSEVYVMLNYSEEMGPDALEIERLIEALKFLAKLNSSEELRTKFYNFYCNYKCNRPMELEPVVNLKFTICRPIPWELPAVSLDMGDIQIKQTKTFQLNIMFIGPGKVYLSARTRTAIPGFIASFEDCQTDGCPSQFVFFTQTPDEKSLKVYRNMNERGSDEDVVDGQEDTRLEHAHSFDVDAKGIHSRKMPPEIKTIKDRYTKLSQPFKEKKNPLVLAEMCQITEESSGKISFNLTVSFTAMRQFYEDSQLIEDYLMIDVHLGPSLPILLQGKVINDKV